MSQFENILVVVQNDASAEVLLSKAASMAYAKRGQPARIHAVRVAYEGLADISSKDIDKSTELKRFILQADEDELRETVAGVTATSGKVETAVLWNRRLWEGVIHAAEAVNADLIIKASEDDRKGYIRTPDDWNILREAKVPVLLTRASLWQQSPTVLVAIDALDEAHDQLSKRILSHASALGQKMSGDLHICSFYPLFEPWSTQLGLLQKYKELRKELEHDIAVAVSRLIRSIGAPRYKLHSLEGNPEIGIEQLANRIHADILVIGNHARDGLEAAFIGNTAEKILHQTETDILTIA